MDFGICFMFPRNSSKWWKWRGFRCDPKNNLQEKNVEGKGSGAKVRTPLDIVFLVQIVRAWRGRWPPWRTSSHSWMRTCAGWTYPPVIYHRDIIAYSVLWNLWCLGQSLVFLKFRLSEVVRSKTFNLHLKTLRNTLWAITSRWYITDGYGGWDCTFDKRSPTCCAVLASAGLL